MPRFLMTALTSLTFSTLAIHCGWCQSGTVEAVASPMDERLDTTPIRDLLHLVNTVVEENPGYETTLARFSDLDWKTYRDSCAPYIARNSENPRIVQEVDALTGSPAYQLCFRQFTNLTPDWYRKFVFGLPYIAVDGPGGGIGETLMELCRHRDEVAAWYSHAVSQAGPSRSMAIAEEWLPPGGYDIPRTFFVYGMGGDAFAREGQVCLDLYSIVLVDRPARVRFADPSEIGTERIERVLAHEFHHVYSDGLIYADPNPGATWQVRWKDRIVRMLVSEGTARHCNPWLGLQREITEDSATMRYWINSLNEKLASLTAGSISESDIQAWYDSTYHSIPRQLLTEFLQRRFPDGNLDSLLAANAAHRPDLTHTLGWWMVSRIRGDGGPEMIIGLLSRPDSLFARYNSSVGTSDPALLINAPPARQ